MYTIIIIAVTLMSSSKKYNYKKYNYKIFTKHAFQYLAHAIKNIMDK